MHLLAGSGLMKRRQAVVINPHCRRMSQPSVPTGFFGTIENQAHLAASAIGFFDYVGNGCLCRATIADAEGMIIADQN